MKILATPNHKLVRRYGLHIKPSVHTPPTTKSASTIFHGDSVEKLAPTNANKENLLKEGISPGKIKVTGNTVIDALYYSVERVKSFSDSVNSQAKNAYLNNPVVLVTGHRRENFGDGFLQI